MATAHFLVAREATGNMVIPLCLADSQSEGERICNQVNQYIAVGKAFVYLIPYTDEFTFGKDQILQLANMSEFGIG